MNKRFNGRIEVYEVIESNGRVSYRGTKDGAEFSAKLTGGRVSIVSHPSSKMRITVANIRKAELI